MSSQSSHQECQNYEECKKVALDRLRDAIVLFKAERYTGTLYMAGYVIEIGIKAEFFRLANKRISFNGDKLKDIMEYLTEKASPKKSFKNWLDIFSFPPKTLNELFIFLERITEFYSSVKETSRFKVITQNRYPKENEGSFHDIKRFYEELKGWKKILEEDDFGSKTYNIKDWKVEIRYSYPSEITLEDAKQALETALNFLKDVLKMENELGKIREELELTNQEPESINIY